MTVARDVWSQFSRAVPDGIAVQDAGALLLLICSAPHVTADADSIEAQFFEGQTTFVLTMVTHGRFAGQACLEEYRAQ